jgi:hypothetical protein
MLNLTGKQMYKKCVIVLLCFSIAANLTHWKVLCFGANGHIELESTFHGHCFDDVPSSASDKRGFSYQTGHELCQHCGPCIDVPISIGMIKISRMPEQLNQQFLLQTHILIDTDKLNSSVYDLASNSFTDTSYFDPLHTVILVV